MFGKKKKGGAAKAKDRSMSGSANSAPGFFSAHVEKIVLSGIVLMFGAMLFEGFGKTGYDAKRTPDQMKKDSGDILNQVRNDDHWEAIKDEPNRAVDPKIVKERIQESKAPVVEVNYTVPVLELKSEIDITKRDDPKLLAPIKVTGSVFWASIVTVGDHRWQDPMKDLEDAPRLDAKAKGSERGRKRGAGMDSAGGMGMDAGGMGMPGMDGGMPGMDGAGAVYQGPRKLLPMFDRGFQVFGSSMGMGMGMGMPGTDGGMGAGMPGMDAGAMGTPGMDGSMGAMSEEAQKKALELIGVINIPRLPPKRMVPTPKMFNIVLALVPHEEMYNDYERKFRFSGGYYPPRDQPTYRGFKVQRLDVTDNPLRQIGEDEKGWVDLTDRLHQNKIMLGQIWKGAVPPDQQRPWINYPGLDPRIYGQYRLPDFADPLALDPYLVVVNPPVLVRDFRHLTKHPDIPWSWVAMKRRYEEDLVDFVEKAADAEAIPANPAASMGMSGMDGGMGMGMPGMDGGMGMGMPGMDGGMGMGMPGMDGGMGMGMPGMDGGMGMGGMDMGMSGMGAMGYVATGAGNIVPKHKMIRFYDPLDGNDIGRVYRYRVAVIMDDPNYPDRDPFFPERDLPGPQPTDLMDHVIRRVSAKKFEDDRIIKADDAKFKALSLKDKQKFKRVKRTRLTSPWSEPSDLFRVDRPAEVLVGEVQNSRPTTIATPKGPVQILKEPKVKVVVNTLSAQGSTQGAVVPLVTDRFVGRGAVLNGDKKEVEVINPLTKVVKLFKSPAKGGSVPVRSNTTIADIRGAEPLLNSSGDDPLADMGEVLMVTGSGNVIVNNEWDDQFQYRMYTFADEKEAAKRAASGAGAGMPGMDGAMGMPGS